MFKNLFSGGINLYVKQESRELYDLLCKRARSIGHHEYVKTEGRINLEEILKFEFKKFLVYLAFADGDIQEEEVRYISELTGSKSDKSGIKIFAEDYGLKGECILDTPPISLEPFVRNNIGPETGEVSDQYYDILMLYVKTFNYIGNDFIACNNNISRGEVDALSAYIMMLRESIGMYEKKAEDFIPSVAYKSGSKAKIEDPIYEQLEAKVDGRLSLVEENQNRKRQYFEKIDSEMDKIEERRNGSEVGNLGEYRGENKIQTDKINPLVEVAKNEKTRMERLGRIDNEQEEEAETKFVGKISIADESISLEQLMQELDDLIGMGSVKKEVNNLVNLMKICRLRQEKGLQVPSTTNHLIFLGNPGTGKTTVARILSKIYHSIGVLSKGQLVEVDRSGLVAGYMGQTGIKVMEVIEKAKGGILFIDEAYALTSKKQEGDFGQEAIDVLNKAMEDNKDDLIVIAAGYEDEMQSFLDANPGMKSRFNKIINFPDYSADELKEILIKRAKSQDYVIEEDALNFINNTFVETLRHKPENFGNARSVRNFLDTAINNQANRLINELDLNQDKLMHITLEDVKDIQLK